MNFNSNCSRLKREASQNGTSLVDPQNSQVVKVLQDVGLEDQDDEAEADGLLTQVGSTTPPNQQQGPSKSTSSGDGGKNKNKNGRFSEAPSSDSIKGFKNDQAKYQNYRKRKESTSKSPIKQISNSDTRAKISTSDASKSTASFSRTESKLSNTFSSPLAKKSAISGQRNPNQEESSAGRTVPSGLLNEVVNSFQPEANPPPNQPLPHSNLTEIVRSLAYQLDRSHANELESSRMALRNENQVELEALRREVSTLRNRDQSRNKTIAYLRSKVKILEDRERESGNENENEMMEE